MYNFDKDFFKTKSFIMFCVLFVLTLGIVGCTTRKEVVIAKQKYYSFDFHGNEREKYEKDSIFIITDEDTNCDYIVSSDRSIMLTPRLDRNGQPMCHKQKVTNKLPK